LTDIVTRLLQHPLTKGANLDDPKTTPLRLDIIRSKPFLMKIYEVHQKRVDEFYVPGYWYFIMALIKLIPERLFKKLDI